MFKRAFDLLCALVGLITLSPLLLFIALTVRLTMGKPVLFKQKRPGKDCKPFYLLKFRSMTNEKDASGNLLPNEERLTTFGNKLRETSLDELPSLINVLKGDMSLVGPRPLRMKYLPFFTERQNKRHKVLPGITGYAQVNGRNQNSWEEKFELDVWYVENRSFLLDIKILLQTVINVVKRKDVSPENQYFEVPFDEYVTGKSNEKK